MSALTSEPSEEKRGSTATYGCFRAFRNGCTSALSTTVITIERGTFMSNFCARVRIGVMAGLVSIASIAFAPGILQAQDSQTGQYTVGVNATVFIYGNLTGQPVKVLLTVCVNGNSQPALVGNVFAVQVGGCRTVTMTVAPNSSIGVTPSQAAAGPASGTYKIRETP
jgi:hypothetical protein